MKAKVRIYIITCLLSLLLFMTGFYYGHKLEKNTSEEQRILADTHALVWISTFQNEYAKRGLNSMLQLMDTIQDSFIIGLWDECQKFSGKASEQAYWQLGAAITAYRNYNRTIPVNKNAKEKRDRANAILQRMNSEVNSDKFKSKK